MFRDLEETAELEISRFGTEGTGQCSDNKVEGGGGFMLRLGTSCYVW